MTNYFWGVLYKYIEIYIEKGMKDKMIKSKKFMVGVLFGLTFIIDVLSLILNRIHQVSISDNFIYILVFLTVFCGVMGIGISSVNFIKSIYFFTAGFLALLLFVFSKTTIWYQVLITIIYTILGTWNIIQERSKKQNQD